MLGDPDQDADILAFGTARRAFPRGRWLLVVAGVVVAAAAGLLSCYAVTRVSAPPPPALVKLHGIYLQEQGNGTVLLPAALRHAFRSASNG